MFAMFTQGRKDCDPAGNLHGHSRGGAVTREQAFLIGIGVILFGALCAMPLWNAIHLMQDTNFVFWNGRFIPSLIVGLCMSILTSYVVVMLNSFRRASAGELIGTAMPVSHFFLCLLGLVLVCTSYPLSFQASSTASELLENCPSGDKSYRLYEYSQVLHNIRSLPACASKRSVEQCQGYAEAPPYTDFLKAMEKDFTCSGFCYRPMAESEVSRATNSWRRSTPPTLFSRADFEVSCEARLARDMKNLAGDISTQVFYQGACLLIVAGAITCVQLATRHARKAH